MTKEMNINNHQCNAIVGLLNNDDYKYLTAETFDNQINVSAGQFRDRQRWEVCWMECAAHDSAVVVALRSCAQRRYLAVSATNVSSRRSVTCIHSRVEPECLFYLVVDGKGRWSLQDFGQKLYFSGKDDHLSCQSRKAVWWTPHFDFPCQIHLFSVSRKKYVTVQNHCQRHNDEIDPAVTKLEASLEHPSGVHSVFSLRYEITRKAYHLYSGADGQWLTENVTFDSSLSSADLFVKLVRGMFTIELEKGDLGLFSLCTNGPNGQLILKQSCVNENMFVVRPADFQLCLFSTLNRRYLSAGPGSVVVANHQKRCNSSQLFVFKAADNRDTSFNGIINKNKQFALRRHHKYFNILDSQGRSWETTEKDTGLRQKSKNNNDLTMFKISDSSVDGLCIELLLDGGKTMFPLAQSPTGYIRMQTPLNDDSGITKPFTFIPHIVNRCFVGIRCEYGFLGRIQKAQTRTRSLSPPSSNSNAQSAVVSCTREDTYKFKLGCNLASPEIFYLAPQGDNSGEDRSYHMFDESRLYALVEVGTVAEPWLVRHTDSVEPASIQMLLYEGTHVLLGFGCGNNSMYLVGHRNGSLGFTSTSSSATKFDL